MAYRTAAPGPNPNPNPNLSCVGRGASPAPFHPLNSFESAVRSVVGYSLLLFIALSCFATLLSGCEPKEDLVQTSGRLEFDTDSVLFDTVFTTVRTVTKRLWVYNRNSGAVRTDIALAGTQNATYSLIIDGDAGPGKSNVLIRGRDSLQVLVRAVLGDNGTASRPKEFLVTDQLNFLTNGNAQDVKLVAYGQNAYFHRADIIRTNTVWATDKPHVIINSPYTQGNNTFPVGVAVLEPFTLTIPAGARVYCHNGATMQINGTLLINPIFNTLAGDTVKASNRNLVRFQGDRLESGFADVPGQWGGIFFTASSKNNVVRYCDIKNANFGLEIVNTDLRQVLPDLTVSNTTIRNISGANPAFVSAGGLPGGLVNVAGILTATNCLLTNCGEYAVLGLGGETTLNFCTVANYFSGQAQRQTPSVFFSNAISTSAGPATRVPLNVKVLNSIIWGNAGVVDELLFENSDDYYPTGASGGTAQVRNSVIRSREYAGNADAPDKPGLARAAYGNFLNQDPNFFRSPENGIGALDFSPKSPSPALRGSLVGSLLRTDLRNLPRATNPEIGALKQR